MLLPLLAVVLLNGSILSEAKSDLGVSENSWRVREMLRVCMPDRKSVKGLPWCAAAVSCWVRGAGHKISMTASVSELRSELKRKGFKKVSFPKAGDVAFFRTRSHCAVVNSVDKGSVQVVSGNCLNAVRYETKKQGSMEYYRK